MDHAGDSADDIEIVIILQMMQWLMMVCDDQNYNDDAGL